MPASSKSISANEYTIFHGEGAAFELSRFLESAGSAYSSIHILVDEQIKESCLPMLLENVPALRDHGVIKIPEGEINKNINTVIDIWNCLQEQGAKRNSLLINLGGGVITDMGGFAASTYKRGIDFINIPTTLLAQADAAIGGKTGIDFHEIKNQIGLINSPVAVFVIPGFLKSLDQRNLKSGYAEILKHGLIKDKHLWQSAIENCDVLSEYSESMWGAIIEKSLVIKNEIVRQDPKEMGLRRILNFGHTIGHAVESYSIKTEELPLSHGEAVAIGMICESYISTKVLSLSSKELDEITQSLLSIFGKCNLPDSADTELLVLMQHDKKNVDSNINFTLLNDIGNAVIDQDCEIDTIIEAINYYRDL